MWWKVSFSKFFFGLFFNGLNESFIYLVVDVVSCIFDFISQVFLRYYLTNEMTNSLSNHQETRFNRRLIIFKKSKLKLDVFESHQTNYIILDTLRIKSFYHASFFFWKKKQVFIVSSSLSCSWLRNVIRIWSFKIEKWKKKNLIDWTILT